MSAAERSAPEPSYEAARQAGLRRDGVRPLRGASSALRACHQTRSDQSAEGRVVFTFRIEQDGSIARACAGASSTMTDEPTSAGSSA